MSRLYAGIGSRQTPPDIRALMTLVATALESQGWVLRSGGAQGADLAFQSGVSAPSTGLELFTVPAFESVALQPALDLAAQHHPAWDRCSSFARRAHARNGFILLGSSLDTPVSFVLCWTVDGRDTGGTGQGIRMAQALGIPIRNLHCPATRASVGRWLDTF